MNFFNVLAELLEASGFAALTWQNKTNDTNIIAIFCQVRAAKPDASNSSANTLKKLI